MDWIEVLCDDIDAERLRPRSHAVSRRLIELEGFDDPLAAEIVAAFDADDLVSNKALLTRLWNKIDTLGQKEQGRFRTLVALLQPDAPIDSYYASYLIGWAQDEGVESDAIAAAFRRAS